MHLFQLNNYTLKYKESDTMFQHFAIPQCIHTEMQRQVPTVLRQQLLYFSPPAALPGRRSQSFPDTRVRAADGRSASR